MENERMEKRPNKQKLRKNNEMLKKVWARIRMEMVKNEDKKLERGY